MGIRFFVLLTGLLACLAAPLAAAPEGYWLARQRGVSVVADAGNRAIYRVRANGDKLLEAYRARLMSAKWRVISTVYSGPMRHLRMRRGKSLVDATLQVGQPASKLTVTTSSSPSRGTVTDKVIQGDEVRCTWKANGGALVINGNHCEVTVKGDSSIVRVNGSHNEVRLMGAVAAILTRGSDNLVRWSRGRNKNGPVVTSVGTYNVTRGE